MANGYRLSKNVNGKETRYLWDGDNITAELNSLNVITNKYYRGINLICGSSNNYYLHNAHGDVIATLNGTTLKDKNLYNAFGIYNILGSERTTDMWGYCDQLYDFETGNYYMRARYYNPNTGRFINEDPIKDGANWYSYCYNNPLTYNDLFGLKPGYVGLRDWVEKQQNIDYVTASISWNQNTKTASVLMSNNSSSETASFSVGKDGNYIEDGSLFVKEEILWQTFGSIIDPGLEVDPIKDAVILGLTAGTLIYAAPKAVSAIKSIASSIMATSTTGISIAQVNNALTRVENKANGVSHIMASKHSWDQVGAYNWTDVKSIITKVVTNGKMEPYKNVTKFVYDYKGRVIEVTGNFINGVLNISDAWVKTR